MLYSFSRCKTKKTKKPKSVQTDGRTVPDVTTHSTKPNVTKENENVSRNIIS